MAKWTLPVWGGGGGGERHEKEIGFKEGHSAVGIYIPSREGGGVGSMYKVILDA